jgi:transporter family protein
VIADWAIFAIIAVFIWAVANIIDKYLLSKWVRNPIILIIFTSVIGVVAGLVIFFYQGLDQLSTHNLILAMIAGISYMLGTMFYFKAAKIDEISRVAPLFHLAPIFVLILAAIFLGERFSIIKYFGTFLLIGGAFLISSKDHFSFKFGGHVKQMVLSTFCFSLTLVITKYLLDFADFWSVFSYIRFGTIFVLVPILYTQHKELINLVKKKGKKVVGLISFNESINVFAVLLMTIAASSGFITLVESLASLQALFVFLLALGISMFYPKILKEEISGSTIIIKIVAIIILIVGSIMIL